MMCTPPYKLEGLDWNEFDGVSSSSPALDFSGHYPDGTGGWGAFGLQEYLCEYGFPNCLDFKPILDNRAIEEVQSPVLPPGQWLKRDPGPMMKPFPALPPAFSFPPSTAVTEATGMELFPELSLFPPSFFPTQTILPDPQSLQPDIPPCLSSTISPHTILLHHHHHHASEHRRKRRDPREISEHNQQLLDLRRQGVSYKAIRERLGLSEAESTLRGRLRTLTKPKCQRLRQPMWLDADIGYLLQAVIPDRPPKWKSISQAIVDLGGSYKFGPSTCKKQYLKLVAEGRAKPLVGCPPKSKPSRVRVK